MSNKFKQITRNASNEAVYATILARVSNANAMLRYAVLEELCSNYDEMANFYNHIKEYGVTVVGEFPARVKRGLFEYGIDVDEDKRKGAI